MRKACIITVYNSENCGSYWLAFTLQEFLRSLGYDVFFLKRKTSGTSHSVKSVVKRCLGHLKRGEVNKVISPIKQYGIFERYIERFQTVEECTCDFDLCVLGSDTIWNLESKYFRDNRNIYWGGTSKAEKTISYAASVANSTESLVAQFPELRGYMENIDSISVRDTYTEHIVHGLVRKNIQLVCDPTMLFDKEFYQKYLPVKKSKKGKKNIFVYYFGKMPEVLETKVRIMARENNADIVVMGGSMEGDVQKNCFDPYAFIECFNNADFVLTNTFHGTIFTLLFEKPAVFNSDGKNKVKELLRICQLEALDCCDDLEHVDAFFEKRDIDYQITREHINLLRSKSREFLQRCTAK